VIKPPTRGYSFDGPSLFHEAVIFDDNAFSTGPVNNSVFSSIDAIAKSSN
jgi:hypothetical protein